MIQELRSLFKLDKNESIPWARIEELDFNQWYRYDTGEMVDHPVPGATYYKRFMTHRTGQMIFLTRVYKDSDGYLSHSHPDAVEYVSAITHPFIVNGQPTLRRYATFYKKTLHSVKCPPDLDVDYIDLIVEFIHLP